MHNDNPQTQAIEISEAPLHGVGGQRYRVTLRNTGEVLIERARDPEWEAARLLRSRGYTGMLEVYWSGRAHPSFRLPIAKAAELSTSEGNRTGLRIGQWRPFSVFSNYDQAADAA